MRKSRLTASAILLTTVLAVSGLFIGCDEDSGLDSVGAFFSNNEHQAALRDDGSVALVLSPLQADISSVGQRVAFRAKGAVTPVTWSPANRDIGRITIVGVRSDYAVYESEAVGPNTVLAVDAAGRTATAKITVGGDALQIIPNEMVLVQPSVGFAFNFVVAGGTPPYGEWTESIPALGTVTPAGAYSVTALGAVGTNLITISDAGGDIASATVAHVLSAEAVSIIPSTTSLSTNGETATLLASGGVPGYSWSVVYPSRGGVAPAGGTSTTYTRTSDGDQIIVLTDAIGQTAQTTISQPTPTTTPLSITPSTVTMATNATSVGFAVIGGISGYTWTYTGPNPGGFSAGTDTATYTRSGDSGTGTVRVEDSSSPAQTVTATITIE